MPRYFFDLVGPQERQIDDVGLTFNDLDAAYIDAHRAIDDISLEMLRDRIDYRQYRFEIRDDGGRLLMEALFDERLRNAAHRPSAASNDLAVRVKANLARNRSLRSEVAGRLDEARAGVDRLRATLERAGDAAKGHVDTADG
jgi:hypothetical protein